MLLLPLPLLLLLLTCTGYTRPSTDSTAGLRLTSPPPPAAAAAPRRVEASKKERSLSTSSVALLTMRRRLGRRFCTFFSSPSSVSVARLRSWASSTITTLQQGGAKRNHEGKGQEQRRVRSTWRLLGKACTNAE
jgi:hypothetical protein